MDPLVNQLAHLCATERTRAKWVFVPTHAIGRTLGDRLVLEGTGWANLRFVTPLEIALRMGAPFLSVKLDPARAGADASRVAEEVIAHLIGLVGADVRVTPEIETDVSSGFPEKVVRTVTQNGRTLKFTQQGFETE